MRTGMICRFLADRGDEVTWFAGRFNHLEKTQRDTHGSVVPVGQGISIRLLNGISYRRNISLKRVVNQSIVALQFLYHAFRSSAPRCVIISWPSPELAVAGAIYCRIKRVPYFVDYRDPWPTIFRAYATGLRRVIMTPIITWYELLLRIVMSQARAVFSPSSTMLADALTRSRRPVPAHLFHLAYPRPTEPAVPLPSTFSAATPLTILFVGSFGNSYDVPLLIEIARLLQEREDKRFRFNIVGDGEMRAEWETAAKPIESVTFTGWISGAQLKPLLARSHVGAVLYRGGTTAFTMPNKLGEYLSAGLALLNSVGGELPALVDSERIGLNISSDQGEKAAVWLQSLADNPAEVQGLRDRSLRIFADRFQSEEVYPKMLATLDSYLDRVSTTK